jgi:hypothetical protein
MGLKIKETLNTSLLSSLSTNELKRTLTPAMLWGLGVGYVISGMYFGWNLGLEREEHLV